MSKWIARARVIAKDFNQSVAEMDERGLILTYPSCARGHLTDAVDISNFAYRMRRIGWRLAGQSAVTEPFTATWRDQADLPEPKPLGIHFLCPADVSVVYETPTKIRVDTRYVNELVMTHDQSANTLDVVSVK